MNKSLNYPTICLCAGGLTLSNVGLAKSKTKPDCLDVDVALSKQYPSFDPVHGCVGAWL